MPDAPRIDDTFQPEYFRRLRTAHEHWWVRGMGQVSDALLARCEPPLNVLDAGCGTGSNLERALRLSGGRRIQAFDLYSDAFRHAVGLEVPVDLVRASIVEIPFKSDHFDVTFCFDVLQHLTEPDEHIALTEITRVLKPGGLLLARTGAVWGRKDVAQRSDWRLYTPERLGRAVGAAGLDVRRLAYANSIPALWTLISKRRRRPVTSDETPEEAHYGLGVPREAGQLRSRLLNIVLALEARCVRRFGRGLPFGHSLYVVASKAPAPMP